MSELRRFVKFLSHDGFPFDEETFDNLQTGLEVPEHLGLLGSDTAPYIISGCVVTGSDVTDGWIYLNGHVYPLHGGTGVLNTYIQVRFTYTDAVFNDGISPVSAHKYADAYLAFGAGIVIANPAYGDADSWSNVITLPHLDQMFKVVTPLVTISSFSNNWIAASTVKYLIEQMASGFKRVTVIGWITRSSGSPTPGQVICSGLPHPAAAVEFVLASTTDPSVNFLDIAIQTNGNMTFEGIGDSSCSLVLNGAIQYFI